MAEKLTTRIEAPAEEPEVPKSSVEGTSQEAQAQPVQGAPEQGADVPKADSGFLARTSQWFEQTFPHSKNAVIGGLCGLLAALLLFSIGLFKTLVIAVLVLVGVAAGQYLDGDPKLVKAVQNLMKKR